MKKNKEEFKFVGRKHSTKAIIAIVVAVFMLAALFAMIVLSAGKAGEAGVLVGLLGMLFFMTTVFGFVIAIMSLTEKDIFYVAPITSVFLNGVALVAYLVVFLTGF